MSARKATKMVLQKHDAEIAKAMGSEAVRMTEGLEAENSRLRAHVKKLESSATWRRIDGPGIDGQRVMLRELDPFDKYNRGDENRDAIAAGYWSDEYKHFVWPFGCTDHPPTHWAPMPDRLTNNPIHSKSVSSSTEDQT